MLEKQIEAYLVARVKESGGIAYKFTSPSRRNVPDRMCVFPRGMIVFIECKRPGAKPTAGQAREHQRLADLGAIVFVIDSLRDVDVLVDSYGRAPQ